MWLVPSSSASALEEPAADDVSSSALALGAADDADAALQMSVGADAAGHVEVGGFLRGLQPEGPRSKATPSNAPAAARRWRDLMPRL
jgi:hypothetical protein